MPPLAALRKSPGVAPISSPSSDVRRPSPQRSQRPQASPGDGSKLKPATVERRAQVWRRTAVAVLRVLYYATLLPWLVDRFCLRSRCHAALVSTLAREQVHIGNRVQVNEGRAAFLVLELPVAQARPRIVGGPPAPKLERRPPGIMPAASVPRASDPEAWNHKSNSRAYNALRRLDRQIENLGPQSRAARNKIILLQACVANIIEECPHQLGSVVVFMSYRTQVELVRKLYTEASASPQGRAEKILIALLQAGVHALLYDDNDYEAIDHWAIATNRIDVLEAVVKGLRTAREGWADYTARYLETRPSGRNPLTIALELRNDDALQTLTEGLDPEIVARWLCPIILTDGTRSDEARGMLLSDPVLQALEAATDRFDLIKPAQKAAASAFVQQTYDAITLIRQYLGRPRSAKVDEVPIAAIPYR